MKNGMKMLVAMWALVGLSACDDPTGADGSGRVEVAAVGDGGGSSSAMSPSYSSAGSGGAEGTVEFRARVYLRTEAGAWEEVTQGTAARAVVSASGSGGATTFASSRVEASSYTRVRVVFEQVRADVTGGVQIGLGTVLQGEVTVDLTGSGDATVERDVAVQVRGDSAARLVIDLNSDAWLSRADAETRAVSRADFESAVRVYVE